MTPEEEAAGKATADTSEHDDPISRRILTADEVVGFVAILIVASVSVLVLYRAIDAFMIGGGA